MSSYVMRVTIACPIAMVDDANDLAMVLGEGPADGSTFGTFMCEDGDGAQYAVTSTVARAIFPVAATSTLSRPAWDSAPYTVNMAGAERAQAALVVYDPSDPVIPAPSRILAVIGNDAGAALAVMGLTALVTEGD